MVNKKELDSLLQKFSSKAYELAYTLVPDDLQASQIVVDATTTFLVTEMEWLMNIDTEDLDRASESELKKDFYLYFMKSVFSLGMKRFTQLPNLKTTEKEDNQSYFQLDGKTRALVFLKYKENLSMTELMDITTLEKSEVMSRLFQGLELLGDKKNNPMREVPPELPLNIDHF
ncbi:MAG: hypothetical protein ACOYL6_00920 [Bacteriovoracaceae bacterium]